MHTKQEMNAENLRQRKLTTIRQRVSGVQSGVMKSKHRDLYTCMTVPIYNRCSALRCYWTPPYCDVYPIEKKHNNIKYNFKNNFLPNIVT